MSEEGTPTDPTPAPAEPTHQEPTPDWREGLPEDIAGHSLVRDSADVAALAKQAIDLQAYQGQSIRIPSEHASEEDVAAFRDKLRQHAPNLIEADLTDPEAVRSLQRRIGLPEEAAGYRRPEMEVPEGVELDYSMLDTFQPLAHKVGLTQDQFEGIVSEFSQANAEQAVAARRAHQEAMEALQREWGYTFNDKLKGAKAVAALAKEHVPAFATEDITSLGAGTLRFLADIASRLSGGEGGLELAEGGEPRNALMTPAEASARRQEILRNREHPYWRMEDPMHHEAIAEMRKLTHLMLGPEGRESAFQRNAVGEPDELHFEGNV